MRIILRGGPHDGERHDDIRDDCVRFHRVASFYGITPEINSERLKVFKYDREASERNTRASHS
jgi:hypothetical protein